MDEIKVWRSKKGGEEKKKEKEKEKIEILMRSKIRADRLLGLSFHWGPKNNVL